MIRERREIRALDLLHAFISGYDEGRILGIDGPTVLKRGVAYCRRMGAERNTIYKIPPRPHPPARELKRKT